MAIESAAVTLKSALVTLGRFELRVEDRAAPPPPTHKARALLAFLVSNEGRDIGREHLLELFWSEFEPERAREGLRTALSSIRHALRNAHEYGDELLFADKAVVRWIGNTEFDVARFDELAHSKAPADKRATLKLYGGDFLEGTYEEWAVTERERIAGVYESVLGDLVEQERDVQAARLLLARNPFHEQAYAALIDAQLQGNRPSAAAELIAQYRAAMREMKASPSAEFEARFAHVQELNALKRATARYVEKAKTIAAPAIAGHTNLPSQLSSFVGREGDLAELLDLIRRSRLVTLVGAGGIGKTRLAIEAGAALRGAFEDGVWLVELEKVSDPNLVASAIASALGVSSDSAHRPLQDTLVTFLQNRHALLILDNSEHIVAAVARVIDAILRGCPNVTILTTSRQPISAEGERVVRLSSLSEADAINLFVDRAKAAAGRFLPDDRSLATIGAICRRLDGMPLAIELAAPRVSVLSLKRLQTELETHFQIVSTNSSMALPRHKTVRALVDWSYDLLSPEEQALLRYAGVFVGGFALDAMRAIFRESFPDADVLDLLSLLVGKSLILVEADPDRERYRLLQTTQQYALDKMRENGELSAVRQHHADYFLALAQDADASHARLNARDWLQRYQREIDNVRAAIDYYFESGDMLSGATLISAARELWLEFAPYAEGLHRAEHAVHVVRDDAPLSLRAGLWLVIGQLGNILYLTAQALESSQRSVGAFEQTGDDMHLAYALQTLGFSLIRSGAYEEAEAVLRRAQALAERLGNRRVVERVLLRRGHNAYAMGELERALPIYERCLQLARALEDELYIGYVFGHTANVYFAKGDYAQSISYGLAAREIFQRRRDTAKESNALSNLAEAYLASGEIATAKQTAKAGLTRARESESTVNAYTALQTLAAVAAREGAAKSAALVLGFALSRLSQISEAEYKAARDRAMEALQQHLDASELQSLLDEGATLSEDEAVTLALSA